MVPCAFCARKHLSAAIAYYADSGNVGRAMQYHGVLVARALINLCEADEGYDSHRPFAIGLLVKAEQECTDTETRNAIRRFRLDVCDHNPSSVFPGIYPTELEWYRAHACEAEREFPDIITAVEREPFYRDNMSDVELKQAEVCCVLPNWFYTEGVWSADVRYAGVSRLAWVLTYEDNGSEIVSQNIFYVDYYTGELIGGDAV